MPRETDERAPHRDTCKKPSKIPKNKTDGQERQMHPETQRCVREKASDAEAERLGEEQGGDAGVTETRARNG